MYRGAADEFGERCAGCLHGQPGDGGEIARGAKSGMASAGQGVLFDLCLLEQRLAAPYQLRIMRALAEQARAYELCSQELYANKKK